MIFITAARVTCFVLALTAIGCRGKEQEPAATAVASQAGFDSVAARLVTALRTDAADSVLALMADDVVLMPPNEPVLKGAGAVRTWYEGLITQLRTSSLVISDREVRMGDEWVTEVAGYAWTLTPVAGGAGMTERGSYVQIWHRESDGRYRLTRELWNSSVPLAPSAGN
jgi:ketosteroid isomerase-like protein